MTPLAALLYLGLAVSLGIYGWRAYRHFVHHETREDRRQARLEAKLAANAGATAPAHATTLRTGRSRPTADGSGDPADDAVSIRDLVDASSREPDLPEAPEGQLVKAVIEEELARKRAADASGSVETSDGPGTTGAAGGPASSRAGLFAPRDASAPPARSVVEVLEGITMPCDLAPYVDLSTDPHHVAFVTSGVPAAEVGAGIADELERLGFTLQTDADTELRATKDDDQLRVVIHPDAANARLNGQKQFPAAPGGSVIVEFRT